MYAGDECYDDDATSGQSAMDPWPQEKSYATLRDSMVHRCCYCQRPCTGKFRSHGKPTCQWCWRHGVRETEEKRVAYEAMINQSRDKPCE